MTFFVAIDCKGLPTLHRFVAIDSKGLPTPHRFDACDPRRLDRYELVAIYSLEELCALSKPGSNGPFGPYFWHTLWLVDQQVRRLGDVVEHAISVSTTEDQTLVKCPGGTPVRAVVLRRRYSARSPQPGFRQSSWTTEYEELDSPHSLLLFPLAKPAPDEVKPKRSWMCALADRFFPVEGETPELDLD